MKSEVRSLLTLALGLALIASATACGEDKKTDEDGDDAADIEEEDLAGDLVTDPPEDPVPEAEEPTPDPAPDPTEDPSPDPTEDPTGDPGADATPDPTPDPIPDAVGEDVDEDADAVDDVPDDMLDEDAGGPTPSPAPTCTHRDLVAIPVPSGLPYVDAAATNCGAGNDYSVTCLDSYDGGEELIYKLDVTSSTEVNVWIDPRTTGWTGLALDPACPLGASTCMASSTRSSAVVHDLGCQTLAAGTYYIQVDTWPSPTCIPDYDLHVHECVCTPAATSCLDSTTLRVCNDMHAWDLVTCINTCGDTGGGVDGCLATSTETEPNDDATNALTHNLITLPWDGNGEIATGTDEDYYAFTLSSPAYVTIQTDAHGSSPLTDTKLWLYESTFTVETPPACSSTSGCIEFDEDDGPGLYSLVGEHGLPPGTYYVRVASYSSSYTGTYRLTIWVR